MKVIEKMQKFLRDDLVLEELARQLGCVYICNTGVCSDPREAYVNIHLRMKEYESGSCEQAGIVLNELKQEYLEEYRTEVKVTLFLGQGVEISMEQIQKIIKRLTYKFIIFGFIINSKMEV